MLISTNAAPAVYKYNLPIAIILRPEIGMMWVELMSTQKVNLQTTIMVSLSKKLVSRLRAYYNTYSKHTSVCE